MRIRPIGRVHPVAERRQTMEQRTRNAAGPGEKADARAGVPSEVVGTIPTVAERHLPVTVVFGVVLVLGDAIGPEQRLRRQSLADELAGNGIVSLVAPDLPSPNGDNAGARAAGLGQAIIAATDRLVTDWRYRGLPLGYLALHGYVGAALVAASQRPEIVQAVVGACGNPLDAGAALSDVRAPTLFIVDEIDAACVDTHRRAQHGLHVTNALKTVPDCRHVLDVAAVRHAAASMALDWFNGFLLGQRV